MVAESLLHVGIPRGEMGLWDQLEEGREVLANSREIILGATFLIIRLKDFTSNENEEGRLGILLLEVLATAVQNQDLAIEELIAPAKEELNLPIVSRKQEKQVRRDSAKLAESFGLHPEVGIGTINSHIRRSREIQKQRRARRFGMGTVLR